MVARRRSATPARASGGLRERKAAQLRLATARALNARLATKSLAEVSVEELAADVGISRMTFFNHFETKEHALELLVTTWMVEQGAALRRDGLRGLAALEVLFANMGGWVQQSPDRVRQILAYYAARPGGRPVMSLSRAELEAIAPGLGDVEVPTTLGATLLELAAQAREAGEISLPSSDFELAHLLGGVLFGACLVGRSTPNLDWRAIYLHHLHRILGTDVAPQRAEKQPKRQARARKR